MLELAVSDDGTGWRHTPPQSAIGSGVGLSNTQLRLQRLHGDNQNLELSKAPDSDGAQVRLTLPFVCTNVPVPA
jgi:LytS/YehU family sensor histidine kinase